MSLLKKNIFFSLLILLSVTIVYTCNAQNRYLKRSFEDSDYLSGWARKEGCCDYSISRSDSVASKGKYSIRVELRKTDSVVQNGLRSEVIWNYEKSSHIERWYGFDIFLPKSFAVDSAFEILAQWHDVHDSGLTELPHSPPISLRIENDHWELWTLWSPVEVKTDKTTPGKKIFDLDKFKTNKWTKFVFHIKFSCDSDGVIEVWKNGEKVVNYNGPNYYNDKRGPFFKIGIYKPLWIPKNIIRYHIVSPVNRRVLFFDNIRVGDENMDLNQMSK